MNFVLLLLKFFSSGVNVIKEVVREFGGLIAKSMYGGLVVEANESFAGDLEGQVSQ